MNRLRSIIRKLIPGIVAAACFFAFSGCEYEVPITAKPTRKVDEKLLGDWTTKDLAAHLVVRERRLDAAPGIIIPALADYTARVQNEVAAAADWDELLDKVASGPPLLSPFKVLDPLVNVGDMFLHHEDVRRAVTGWEPRDLDDATAPP